MNYFVLTNDPDHGLLDNYRKIFRELNKRGIFVTTAVFCTLKDDGSALSRHCFKNETLCLADEAYKNFMLELRDLGHEIALHGYSQVSDTRDEFQKSIDIFHRVFKEYPKIYIEHGGHPKSHSLGMCKKENLKVEGSLPDSRYFVKDIIRDVFDLVWTCDYLLDGIYEPLSMADIFQLEDGILYFKRWRMTYIQKLATNLSQDLNTIVGYTHFGYRGYESRYAIKNFFRKNTRLEWWSEKNLHKTAALLAQILDEHHLKSLTLSDLLKTAKGSTV